MWLTHVEARDTKERVQTQKSVCRVIGWSFLFETSKEVWTALVFMQHEYYRIHVIGDYIDQFVIDERWFLKSNFWILIVFEE